MSRNRIDEVYEAIRTKIVRGEYYPSQHLAESHLAKELNVGRHIVRLALERLDLEGLVTIQPNRGAVVTRLELDDAVDILYAREALEGAAARLAAQRIDAAGLDALGALVREMEQCLAAGDFDDYSATNGRFHQVIYDASGSRQIPSLLATLRARLVRFQFRTVLIPGRAEQSLAEHRRIYEALLARDADASEQAMRAHIANLRETITKAWELART